MWVYKEVVEARSNYKKSYFWLFGNPTCGDSTGGDRTEKDQGRKREKEQCNLMWVEHL